MNRGNAGVGSKVVQILYVQKANNVMILSFQLSQKHPIWTRFRVVHYQ